MSGPFAKTAFGPPAPGTTDPNKGALIADVQNGVAEMVDSSGNTHGIETTLLMLQAQTALATITTAQTLMSQALLAQALNKKNRTLQITGSAVFTVSSGTPTVAIAIKLGSTTLATITSAALQAVTNGQLTFEFFVSVAATGASGTLETHGNICVQLGATNTPAMAQYNDINTAVSSAVDLTAAQTLAVTIVGSTTIAAATLRQAQIQVMN